MVSRAGSRALHQAIGSAELACMFDRWPRFSEKQNPLNQWNESLLTRLAKKKRGTRLAAKGHHVTNTSTGGSADPPGPASAISSGVVLQLVASSDGSDRLPGDPAAAMQRQFGFRSDQPVRYKVCSWIAKCCFICSIYFTPKPATVTGKKEQLGPAYCKSLAGIHNAHGRHHVDRKPRPKEMRSRGSKAAARTDPSGRVTSGISQALA